MFPLIVPALAFIVFDSCHAYSMPMPLSYNTVGNIPIYFLLSLPLMKFPGLKRIKIFF